MKKNYESVEVEIVVMADADVVTLSDDHSLDY